MLTDADNGRPVDVVVGTTIVVKLQAPPGPGPLRWTPGNSLNPKVLENVDLGADSPNVPLAEFRAIAPGQSEAYAFGPVPAECACTLMPIGFLITVLPLAGVSSGSPSPPPDRSLSPPVAVTSRPDTSPSPGIPSSQASVPPSSMPPRVVLTNADSGQSLVVSIGATIEVDVHVFTPSALSISAPTSDEDTVLHQISASPGGSRTSTAVFLAIAPGLSEVSALEQGSPCASGAACTAFGIGFYITVVR